MNEANPQLVHLDVPASGDPTGLRRINDAAELSNHPDETVVIWRSQSAYGTLQRQAGVVETAPDGTRQIRPISTDIYERNYDLTELMPPIWVVTFDDSPPADRVDGTPKHNADNQTRHALEA